MSSSSKQINPTVRLPIQVKLFEWNRRWCVTIPKDLARLLDVTPENVTFEVTIIEGGLAFYVKRKGGFST